MSETKLSKSVVLAGSRRVASTGVTSTAEKIIKSRTRKPATESVPEIEQGKTETPETIQAKKERAHLNAIAKEVDKLFTAKNFKGVVRAPADLMLATTGRRIWNMPDAEAEALAETGSMCAKQFVKADAKWLALILFSTSLITTYGGRAMMHMQEVRKEKASRGGPSPIEKTKVVDDGKQTQET